MDSNVHRLAIRYISPHTCHPTVTQTASFDGSQRRLTLSLSAQQGASRTEADTRGLPDQRSHPASHVLDGSEREEQEEKEKNEEDEQGGEECDSSDRDYETDLESAGINTVGFRIEKSEIAVPIIWRSTDFPVIKCHLKLKLHFFTTLQSILIVSLDLILIKTGINKKKILLSPHLLIISLLPFHLSNH